jgi:curli biogenesis system outer membrane secretion channel CsgG
MKKLSVYAVIGALVAAVGYFVYAEPTLGVCVAPATSTSQISRSYSTPSCKVAGKALGVLPFYSDITSVGLVVSDTAGANLIDSGCKIIERSYLATILKEHGPSQTGITESIDYRKIGKITNVDYLLVGNVEAKERSKFLVLGRFAQGGQYTEISGATARIVDVFTGQVVVAVTWHKKKPARDPIMVGEELASAIKQEIMKPIEP